MKNHFECTVRYERASENGSLAKVTERYLVDALSFTEAETKMYQEIRSLVKGDFSVQAIKRKKYSDIVNADETINKVDSEINKIVGANRNQSDVADRWFECKLNYITLDEEKGVEKKTPVLILVNANSVNSANDTLIRFMKGSMADYTIEKVAETKIITVF